VKTRENLEFEAWVMEGRVVAIFGEPSIECEIVIEFREMANEPFDFSSLGDRLMKLGFKTERIRTEGVTDEEWEGRAEWRRQPVSMRAGVPARDRHRHKRAKAVSV
jgi:hypothetical protein